MPNAQEVPNDFVVCNLKDFPRPWLISKNGLSVNLISKMPLLIELVIDIPSAWNPYQWDVEQGKVLLNAIYTAKSCFPEIQENQWDIITNAQYAPFNGKVLVLMFPSCRNTIVTTVYASPHADIQKKRLGIRNFVQKRRNDNG